MPAFKPSRLGLVLCCLAFLDILCSAQVDLARLRLPAGFKISIFADTHSSPRMMAFSPAGVLLVTTLEQGSVLALPDPTGHGTAEKIVTVLHGLRLPHGIAFHNGKLYVAETDKVVDYDWEENALRANNPRTIIRLSGGGTGHATRTILFANGKLYVSVGSSCNECEEDDPIRATVLQFDEDGSNRRIFARGVRNAVGLAHNPASGTVWVTDNGRDRLGDDVPPDEIDDLGPSGGDFGWPYCYGDKVPDPRFHSASRCASTIPPVINLQAHSAPLGLAFYQGQMFPRQFRGDLFIAYHGSWNRRIPTGYKVVRIPMSGPQKDKVEDFISGWLAPGETRHNRYMGRPVGIVVGGDGSMYISDDSSGMVYRVTYAGDSR
jgi:glucose/arabinose dehydrogenase